MGMRELTCRRAPRKLGGEEGYILLAVLFLVAMVLVTLAIAAPQVAADIERDREMELMHRGKQYARAIKLYYKKFGTYPPNIEALEKTNDIRFLRKRYVDPVTGKDVWHLIHFGENKTPTAMGFFGQPIGGVGGSVMAATGPGSLNGGSTIGSTSSDSTNGSGNPTDSSTPWTMAASLGAPPPSVSDSSGSSDSSGFGSSGFGGNSGGSPGQNPPNGGQGLGNSSSGSPGFASSGFGSSGSGTSGIGNSNSGSSSSSAFGSSAGNNQTFGGMGIIGVESTSPKPTILEYKKKHHFNEWEFVYDPMADQMMMMGGGNTGLGGQQNGTGIGNPTGSSPNPNPPGGPSNGNPNGQPPGPNGNPPPPPTPPQQ